MSDPAAAAAADVVFVVDASPHARAATGRHLRELGCEPVLLDSGDACLAELARRPHAPALVLLDLHLPGLRGDETCQRLKENPAWRDVPVIILTPGANPAEVMYCWRAAADDYLPKPASITQLDVKLAAVRAAGMRAPPGPRRGRTLLLVDDSRFYRTLVGGALEHEGFEVAYAYDAAEARTLLATRGAAFDGFVLDVNLPDGSGLQLLEGLRATPALAGRRALLQSAFPQDRTLEAAALRLTGAPLLEKRAVPADVLVRRIVAHFAGEHAGADLRAAERAPFFSTVEFDAGRGEPLSGFSYDASPGGLFVRTLTPLPTGSPVRLQLRLASQPQPYRAEGTVAWANGFRPAALARAPVGMGVRLGRVDAALVQQFPRLAADSAGPRAR